MIAPKAPHRELPGWARISIFALTLFVMQWLVMAVFFKRAGG